MTSVPEERTTTQPLRVVLATWQREEEFLRQLTFPVTLLPIDGQRDDAVAEALVDADALVGVHFTRAMGAKANRLRLIQANGAGTNLIDRAAVPAGATVCNVYGHDSAIAEYVVMTMIALTRDLLGLDRRLRHGEWHDHAIYQSQIRGRTLGLIGLGHIGAAIARQAQCFGMRVLAVTKRPAPERAAELGLAFLGGMDELDRVLTESDFVVLAIPLVEETQGLLGGADLQRMKPTAYLINVARGEVIDESALYEALRHRTIAGAAIDVWYRYPEAWRGLAAPANLPFHELSNVIMTPHISAWTIDTFRQRWATVAENLRRLAAGEPLLNVVFTA